MNGSADVPEEEMEGCGFEYDHSLRLVDEKDGWVTEECTECGAEIITPPSGV